MAMRLEKCPICKDRGDFPLLLNSLGLVGEGVEVGVWEGDFAKIILSKWGGLLYLVDPWEKLEDYDDPRRDWFTPQVYTNLLRNLRVYEGRYVPCKNFSVDAAKLLPDELDFVYLDANHNYEFVKQDIAAWYPKIRKGGLLAGHDFSPRFPGVEQALQELDDTVYIIPASGAIDGGEQSWYLRRS